MAAEIICVAEQTFVPKPWGWERWVFNDREANLCLKHMCIAGGHKTSIHRHIVKDEVIRCTNGCLIVAYLKANPSGCFTNTDALLAVQTVRLNPGMAIRLQPGNWHILSAIFDTQVYEASTFHDDDDVERVGTWNEAITLAEPVEA